MKKLTELIEFSSGSPQFRIAESLDQGAPVYSIYSQMDLQDDLDRIILSDTDNKEVRTWDKVSTLEEGDLIFSLISGVTVMVGKEHEGYLYTQNYIKLIPKENIEPKFLVYYLNESKFIKQQFQAGLQGSVVMKYTLKLLKNIELPIIPALSKQRIIGDIYFKQRRLQALRSKVAGLETTILLQKLEKELQK